MYDVSNAYKSAMHDQVQRHKVNGYITLNSTPYYYDDTNILQGSMTITNQCSDNEEVKIGSVFVGELKATFINVDIPRGMWKNCSISVNFSLLVDASINRWEDVPVGVFYVAEATHSATGVEIVAYDAMSKLDKFCANVFVSTTAYEILSFGCSACSITLGNTREEIAELPNGGVVVAQYPESDIETWRDMFSWLSQFLGSFVTAGRDGKIYLRQYTSEPVDEIDEEHRFTGSSFSDFATKYTAISVIDMETQKSIYYSRSPDDGLTYDIGANPFLQSGEVQNARRRVLNALMPIDYVPFTTSMIGNIAYDLGDVIRFTGGSASDECLCCVTKFTYTHHGGLSVSGVGKNPTKATGKSSYEKDITGLTNRVNQNEYHYDIIRNGKSFTIGDQESKKVVRASVISKNNATIKFDAEILIEVTPTTGHDTTTCEVTYVLDGTELERHPMETWIAGKHILTLQYVLQITNEGFHVFDTWITIENGTAYIPEFGIMELFSGTGIAVDSTSAGIINLEETFTERISLHNIPYAEDAIGDLSIILDAPIQIVLSDDHTSVSIPQIEVDKNIIAEVAFGDKISDITWGQAYNYTWGTAKDLYHW